MVFPLVIGVVAGAGGAYYLWGNKKDEKQDTRPKPNTPADIQPCFKNVTRSITSKNGLTQAIWQALINKSNGHAIQASIHVCGDCNSGKSQLSNALASSVNAGLQGMDLRQVGTFDDDNNQDAADDQQCSRIPFRLAFSKILGASEWNCDRNGEIFLNDNRGNPKAETFTEQATVAALQGKLAPTEAFPIEGGEDASRDQINTLRAPGSRNVPATITVYCVPARKLLEARDGRDAHFWNKIKRVIQVCKNFQHVHGPVNAELPFLLMITRADELDDELQPIDLLCSLQQSRNADLRTVIKNVKDNLGLSEDQIAVVGFLKNLRERVFNYSDFAQGANRDYAIVALRYWFLDMIARSANYMALNGIARPQVPPARPYN